MRPGWEAVLMKMRYHYEVPDLKENRKIFKFGFDKRKNDAKLNLTLLKRSGADLKACRKKF